MSTPTDAATETPPLGPLDTIIPTRDQAQAEDAPRGIRYVRDTVDIRFRGLARAAGGFVLLVMCFVGYYLATNAWEAISARGVTEFLTTTSWAPETGNFGVAAILAGTVLVATVALVVSLPLSLGVSLFITEIATGRVKRVLQSTIDLMAAIPSLVFGLWGALFLQQQLVPFAQWLSTWFGWIPIFAISGVDPANPLIDTSLYKASTFLAGLVVALMVIPIQTSIMVESFSRAPVGEREGAYALGATRWGMIRRVVIPYGTGGIIGGTMLGLGRALGETIAIYLIINPVFDISLQILKSGSNSVAAHIALRYSEASGFTMSALMAAGFTLFILTMIVNFTASAIIARSRSGADSEG